MPRQTSVSLLLIIIGAAALRFSRLDWQPLWWDEGYSVYFATEPLARMVWLTARDIHPPLYFALAHIWTGIVDSYRPEAFRLFSVLCALPAVPLIAWLAHRVQPQTRLQNHPVGLWSAALLAISPMHIYYSQEIRMYGLALTFTLAATLCLLIYWQQKTRGARALVAGVFYVLTALLALYTLYYSVLLLLAHALWFIYALARGSAKWKLSWLMPFIVIFLLYVPWLAMAVPELTGYVEDKVASDQDFPLGPLVYLWRHWVAFTGGHISAASPWLEALRHVGLLAPLVVLLMGMSNKSKSGSRQDDAALSLLQPSATSRAEARLLSQGLMFLLLVPLLAGYLINLIFPFFPVGGERLLFIILPYFLLLISLFAQEISRIWWRILPPALLGVSALAGTLIFFTTERYADEDYRPLIRAVTVAGRVQDAVLAIFPWQVGYWRAYASEATAALLSPQPPPLDQEALVWDDQLRQRINAALAQGTLWFPAPLGFGSSLPQEIESYLITVAINVEDTWYSPTTRLSAWTLEHAAPRLHVLPVANTQVGAAVLASAHIVSSPGIEATVQAANTPLVLRLAWELPDPNLQRRVRLQLQARPPHLESAISDVSPATHIWASRSYEPLGRYAITATNEAGEQPTGAHVVEDVGILIPAGLPPGDYEIAVSVTPMQASPPEDLTLEVADELHPATTIGTVRVEWPDHFIAPYRLWVDAPRSLQSLASAGLRLHGARNVDGQILAGRMIEPLLQLSVDHSPPSEISLVLELRAPNGSVLSQNAQWPLPQHPPDSWPAGALISAPISLFIPGHLTADDGYDLWAGIDDGTEAQFLHLGNVAVFQRNRHFDAPAHIAAPLDPPIQFGTHAQLLGYTATFADARALEPADNDNTSDLSLTLYWQVLEPIVPPHHIFLHLVDREGVQFRQLDGEPVTVDGPAPTGSWQPGEFVSTLHTFPDIRAESPLIGHAGLYRPETGVRLPASISGEVIGDYAALPLVR